MSRLFAIGLVAAIPLSYAARAGDAALPRVSVMAADAPASEAGNDTASFLILREGASIEKPLVVSFTLSGTATNGTDYVNPGVSVTIPAQSPMGTILIKPIADALTEGAETVVLNLTAKPGVYTLGKDKSAQATIADALPGTGSTSGKPGKGTTEPPIIDPSSRLPAPDHTGTLVVSVTFDGAGYWKHRKNGAYSNLKFHRVLTYTVPLRGIYSPGSGFTEIDRREPHGALALPDFKRYLILQPRDATGPAGRACGKGSTEFLDESSGMEVGDPGQPPLVPFTQTIKGGGVFPSGDRTVTERDLCLTKVSLDYDKHVFHMSLDGTDSHVKVLTTHNGFSPPRTDLPLQGYDNGGVKAKLTWFDVPLPASNAGGFEGSRVIENFNTVSGPMNSTFPLRATVKYRLTLN